MQEVPEFVDGVVDVAQRGRSLGLHLILATQRPAGVIKDNLRANTNLRMALRMADEDDSEDVLGTTAAAYFDPRCPAGRCPKTGPGRLTPFQTGYAGGWTSGRCASAGHAGRDADLRRRRRVGAPGPRGASRRGCRPRPHRHPAHRVQPRSRGHGPELPAPRKPWLPDMRPAYDLADLPTQRRDDELVFGVGRRPGQPGPAEVAFRPDKEGNMAVYGTGGSGKSRLPAHHRGGRRLTVRGGPCHVYGLDFGNRGLAMLEALPHVGSIITVVTTSA